jgi:serine protease Do
MKPNESDIRKQDNSGSSDESTEKKTAASEYRFMDQVIRKKPIDWKKIIFRILWIVIAGVLIGLIAAAVLVSMVPEIKDAYASRQSGGMISISEDTDPDSESVIASSSVSSVSGESVTETSSSAGSASVTSSSSDVVPASQTGDTETSGDNTGDGAVSVSGSSEGENAEEGMTLDDYRSLYQKMMDVADQVNPAVVQVTGISSEMDYFDQDYTSEKTVTGLIVAENSTQLYILTEYHAIDGAESIQVTFSDDSTAVASFRRQDPTTGLCIIYVPLISLEESTRENIVIASLGNSYSVETGEPVLALGSPTGYSNSVAFGAVTSTSGKAHLTDCSCCLLATDIKGTADGSGVLVSLNGEIIGIIDQSLGTDDGETVTCLAISDVKSLIETLSNDEARPYIGVTGQDVTQAISEQTGMPVGVLVTDVAEDSPALLSGIKEYDVITDISGTTISTFSDYSRVLSGLNPGDTVTVTAKRKGADGYSDVTFDVTVGEI